jgi:hypothetical protein
MTSKLKKQRTKRKEKGCTANDPVRSIPGRTWPPLPPNINREDPPEFYRMSFERFEEMTCSLLDKEPWIIRADLYHTRFDAQYGIDCFGDLDTGMVVASCKCQKSVKKGQLAAWSNDFLQHWEKIWKAQGVTKFILSTAAPTHHRARLEDIAKEKIRFAAVGVEYDVWSPRQLQERLRGHRGLVSQYVGAEFVSILCGDEPPSALLGEVLAVQAVLETRVESLGGAFASEVEQRLEEARRTFELGHVTKVQPIVESLRTGGNWTDLPAELQARIVRLQGSVALAQGDIAKAEALCAEAEALYPSDEPRLKANIALRKNGPSEALKTLGEPSTESGRSFRAALLLGEHRVDEAAAVIASLPDTAERLRLLAHVELTRGNRAEARRIADSAMARAPENIHIRRLGAIVRYAQSLSERAEPPQYAYALPFASSLLRSDDDAIKSMSDALDLLDSIVATGERGPDELDQLWRLACLANMPNKRAEASAQAQDILSRKPTSGTAIGWVLVRGLAVDLTASRVALSAALRSGTLDPNGPRALDWTTAAADRPRLLSEVQKALSAHSWSDDVGSELNTLVAKLSDRADVVGEAASVRRLEIALASGQPDSVIDEFRKLREEKPTPILLLGAADALATMGQWEAIAEGISEILAFKTAEATRLAAYAAFNSGDTLQTVSILSENVALFPGGRLPYDLRRMEAQALVRQGEGREAMVRAEALAAETRQIQDRVLEARLRLEVGDLRGTSAAIRSALTLGELEPPEALWWAHRLAQQDLELARQLWRSVVAREDLTDQIVASAFHLSFELGLEHEKPELAAALPRLAAAGAPGIEMVSVDDLAKFVAESRERAARIDDLLTKGDVAIHLIAAATNVSLAELYWLDRSRDAGLRPIFLRSAARPDHIEDRPWDEWNVYIDVTGLMIADQLGLLDRLESQKNRPRIGRPTIQALLTIEERVRHPQPRRVAAAEAILREVGHGVRLIPPTGAVRVVHEPSETEFSVTAVVTGLLAGGWIDESKAAEARSTLNLPLHACNVPSAKQPLIFAEQTLDLIADANLLQIVVSAFDVFIDPAALEITRSETTRAARSAALSTWIAGLRDRVSRGLQAGRYVYAGKEVVPSKEDEAKRDPIYLNLLELLQSVEGDATNRLWIDDRLLNSYQNSGKSRVIGVTDVLDTLRRERKISDDYYFEALRKLRAGGALFIPITIEEISRHLAKAPIVDRRVVETPGLVAIRQNVSLTLMYQDAFRITQPDTPGSRPSELPYLVSLRRLIEGAILDRWNTEQSVEAAQAQCDWIWESLRSEHLPKAPDGQPPRDSVLFAALNIAGLIADAFHINAVGDKSARKRRESYLDWVASGVAKNRLARDSRLSNEVGNLARMLLRPDKLENDEYDNATRAAMRDATKALIYELPLKLQEPVVSDETFRRDLGIDTSGVLTIGGKPFLGNVFWNGIETAVNGTAARIKTADREEDTVIAPPDTAWIFPISGAISVKLFEPSGGFLSSDEGVRGAAFSRLVTDLDIPVAEIDGVKTSLAAADTAFAKMRVVEDLRQRSIPYFLQQLANALRASNNIKLDRFSPPPAKEWLRYLRWVPDVLDPMMLSIRATASQLGADEAARRFSSLPINLPADIESDIKRRPIEGQTMMGLIHRLHALRQEGEPPIPTLTNATDDAIQACLNHGNLFLALLRWGARSFLTQDGWPALSIAEKHAVVWSYADRMTELFGQLGAEPKETAEYFSHQLQAHAARALKLEHGYDDSPLHAGVLSEVGVLLAGLEYALGTEADEIKPNEEQMQRLRSATSVFNDKGVAVVRPERALNFVTTPFPTWLSRPTPNAVVENAGQIESSLADWIAQLENDPDDPEVWGFLLVFGRPALPLELVKRLEAIIFRVDLEKVARRAEDPLLAIRKVAEVSSRLAGTDASDKVLNGLFSLSRTWLTDPNHPAFQERIEALIEAGASASRAYDESGPQRLSGFLRALFANIPGVALSVRPILRALIDQTPVEEAGEFWRALLAARAG